MFFEVILVIASILGTSSAANRSPAEIKQWMMSEALHCGEETNIPSKELLMLMEHKISGSPESKCFLACVFKKIEWVNDKGQFDHDKSFKFLDEEYADHPEKLENSKKVFETCKSVNDEAVTDGDKGCDRSSSLAQCLIDTSAKMGIDMDAF